MKKFGLMGMIVLLAVAGIVHAQDRSGGQFWVRAYEDRNGSGTRDTGEPLITRGIAVDLLDSSGTVIASALLDQSPNATQGLVGFQYLPAGQYTVSVTSAYFTATTLTQFSATIDPSMPPTVVEFGGQRIASAQPSAVEQAAADELSRQELIRVAASGLGALVMIGGMIVVGLLLYALVLRPRAMRRAQRDMIRATQTTTGTIRPASDDSIRSTRS